MTPAEVRVACFLDQNRAKVLASSAAQIAAQLGLSDASVIRAVQSLGFKGLPALKQALADTLGDRANPADNMRRTLAEVGSDASAAIESVLGAHSEGIDTLRSAAGQASIVAAVRVLQPARRIGIFGIGPSAPLAAYAAFQLVRCGRQSLLLDATGRALADQLLKLHSEDAILMLAYGRPYSEAKAVVSEALRMDLPIVVVTDDAASSWTPQATVMLLAQRGRAAQVALHATTLAALEAVILGLAATDRERSLGQLAHLNRLRKLVESPNAGSQSSEQK